MYDRYGHYGAASPGAVAGGATAAASGGQSGHLNPEGFMGMDWRSIMVAVAIGSLTAVLTQLALEHIKAVKESKKKPTHNVNTFGANALPEVK